ncbi:MAG TPA: hypothetical protein VK610_08135, partial [Rhodothermales bacterium]|nr:hypothetical protein [Rhodothermales bacterium]
MHFRSLAPLLILAVAAAGCVSPRYAPSARHTPLMEQAGEVQGRIELGYGAGAAVFVSPLPHVTVFVEGEAEPFAQNQSGSVGRRRTLGGAGLGTYLRHGPYAVELLGGAAAGNVRVRNFQVSGFLSSLPPVTEYTEAYETRTFAQANLGVTQPGSRFTGG